MTDHKTDQGSLTDQELSLLFAAARDEAKDDLAPPDTLFAAIMADAEAHLPERENRLGSLFAEMREALGGWLGLSGLVAASATGLVVGVAAPDMAGDVWTLLGDQTAVVDSYSGFDLLLDEG